MREADAQECAAFGLDPYVAVALSRARSEEAFAVVKDGDLLCEWGYRTDNALFGEASVWMLSFEGADKCPVYFARESRRLLASLLFRFTLLRCEVYSGHLTALRWLQWLGFHEVGTRTVRGELFFLMERTR